MTIIVPHHSTQEVVVPKVDQAAGQLLAVGGVKNIQIVDQKKSWEGSVMSISFTGKMGFISVPLAGTVAVDDTNVTVECELPAMVKNFVGEEKVRAVVEERVRGLVA
jgi:hypothetical protein